MLGRVLTTTGRFDEAAAMLGADRDVLLPASLSGTARELRLLALADYFLATDSAERALALALFGEAADSPGVLFARGRALRAAARPEAALEALDTASRAFSERWGSSHWKELGVGHPEVSRIDADLRKTALAVN